jgi:transcriptional regulator with XRE-family HTH domain
MSKVTTSLAELRLRNTYTLLGEFSEALLAANGVDAMRKVEGAFAEKIRIKPPYLSAIKNGSRRIGHELARQIESACEKPFGWLDVEHAAEELLRPRDAKERMLTSLFLSVLRAQPRLAEETLTGLVAKAMSTDAGGKPLKGGQGVAKKAQQK